MFSDDATAEPVCLWHNIWVLTGVSASGEGSRRGAVAYRVFGYSIRFESCSVGFCRTLVLPLFDIVRLITRWLFPSICSGNTPGFDKAIFASSKNGLFLWKIVIMRPVF